MESFIDYNGPVSHNAEEFLKLSLDRYYGSRGQWHFDGEDDRQRQKVYKVSQVVDRHLQETSRLPFLEFSSK